MSTTGCTFGEVNARAVRGELLELGLPIVSELPHGFDYRHSGRHPPPEGEGSRHCEDGDGHSDPRPARGGSSLKYDRRGAAGVRNGFERKSEVGKRSESAVQDSS